MCTKTIMSTIVKKTLKKEGFIAHQIATCHFVPLVQASHEYQMLDVWDS